jgi:hypothetical protein
MDLWNPIQLLFPDGFPVSPLRSLSIAHTAHRWSALDMMGDPVLACAALSRRPVHDGPKWARCPCRFKPSLLLIAGTTTHMISTTAMISHLFSLAVTIALRPTRRKCELSSVALRFACHPPSYWSVMITCYAMHITIHLLYPVNLTQSRDNGVRSASDTGDSLKTVSTYTMQLCVRVTERKRNKRNSIRWHGKDDAKGHPIWWRKCRKE